MLHKKIFKHLPTEYLKLYRFQEPTMFSFRARKPVLRIRIRVRTDPHPLARSGSVIFLEVNPDPRLQNWHFIN
jgi:hypothetical protein